MEFGGRKQQFSVLEILAGNAIEFLACTELDSGMWCGMLHSALKSSCRAIPAVSYFHP